MQKQGSLKNSQVSSQRPQTSKPFTKIGQEQPVNSSPFKNDLRDSNLRKSKEESQLKDPNLNQVEQQRKMSPPLFKYKPKYLAKHFDPFHELEERERMSKQQIEQQDALQVPEKSGSQPSLNSLNSSHKFKKLNTKELNLLSPIPPPQVGQEKNVFFEDRQSMKFNDQDENIVIQNQENEQKEAEKDPNQDEEFLNKIKQENKKIRPHTAAIMKAAPIKNIFDSAKVYEQYQKSEIGPQYNEIGQIKQYTVLGKPEWYIRQQKEYNKKNKSPILNNDLSVNIIDAKAIDSKSILSNDRLEKIDTSTNQPTTTVGIRVPTYANFGTKTVIGLGGTNTVPRVASMNNLTVTQFTKQSKKPKDEDVLVQDLDEDEVQICIDKVITRVQANKEFSKKENEKQIAKFKKGDQLYLTKEARILQQFEDVQRKQEKLIELRCKLTGKKFEDSVWLREGEARSKIEIKQVLEMVKTDFEKYGAQNFWQKRLRKDKDDRVLAVEAIQQLVKEDNPMSFKPKNQFDQEKKVQIVEQIRKPHSSKLRNDKQNELPFHSFKSHDYLMEKISDRKQFINEIARIDNKEIENIEIIGKSVLRSEIQTLKNNASEKHFIMKVKTQKKEQPPQIQTPAEEQKQQNDKKSKLSPRNRIIFDKPNTTTNTRIQSAYQPSYQNLRSVVKIQILPEKPAMDVFLEQEQNLQNQEEEIIEEKYIPFEMRRGGYVQQQVKLQY